MCHPNPGCYHSGSEREIGFLRKRKRSVNWRRNFASDEIIAFRRKWLQLLSGREVFAGSCERKIHNQPVKTTDGTLATI